MPVGVRRADVWLGRRRSAGSPTSASGPGLRTSADWGLGNFYAGRSKPVLTWSLNAFPIEVRNVRAEWFELTPDERGCRRVLAWLNKEFTGLSKGMIGMAARYTSLFAENREIAMQRITL